MPLLQHTLIQAKLVFLIEFPMQGSTLNLIEDTVIWLCEQRSITFAKPANFQPADWTTHIYSPLVLMEPKHSTVARVNRVQFKISTVPWQQFTFDTFTKPPFSSLQQISNEMVFLFFSAYFSLCLSFVAVAGQND